MKALSIFSLIFGILSLICCCIPVFGIVMAMLGTGFGIFSYTRIKRDPLLNMLNTYKSVAIAGIITSLFGLFLGILLNMLMFWGSFDPQTIVYDMESKDMEFKNYV